MLSQDGEGPFFSVNLGASLFNEDLSNEPDPSRWTVPLTGAFFVYFSDEFSWLSGWEPGERTGLYRQAGLCSPYNSVSNQKILVTFSEIFLVHGKL